MKYAEYKNVIVSALVAFRFIRNSGLNTSNDTKYARSYFRNCYDAWMEAFGRLPKKDSVMLINPETIKSSEFKKNFKHFVNINTSNNSADDIKTTIMIAAIVAFFGQNAEKYIGAGWSIYHLYSMALTISKDAAIWFDKNYKENADYVLEIVYLFDSLGIAVNSKMTDAIVSMIYGEVNDLTKLCYKLNVRPDEYAGIKDVLSQTSNACSIDGFVVSHNGYVVKSLAKGSVDHLVAGHYTRCCQHLYGNGGSCALHSYKSANSTTYAVYKGDKICAIAWTWINDNGDVCFDNIEINKLFDSSSKEFTAEMVTIYTMLAKEINKALNCNVYCGISHSKTAKNLVGYKSVKAPNLPSDYVGYTDTKYVDIDTKEEMDACVQIVKKSIIRKMFRF